MTTALEANSDNKASKAISFAEFLMTVPPGRNVDISDLQRKWPSGFIQINLPILDLYCSKCGGFMKFSASAKPFQLSAYQNLFLVYMCRNCAVTAKSFALLLTVKDPLSFQGTAFKYGENPSFGPPTPRRLLALVEEERSAFLKGRQSENQGLGIGAFAYYRRVIENQKNRILSEIIRVAEKTHTKEATIRTLRAAKAENQFSKAMAMVKKAIPESLKIAGQHNPLSLLHDALSEGIHDLTDEECLERATTVRVVMEDLAERSAAVLRDREELTAAVASLQNRKPRKSQSTSDSDE